MKSSGVLSRSCLLPEIKTVRADMVGFLRFEKLADYCGATITHIPIIGVPPTSNFHDVLSIHIKLEPPCSWTPGMKLSDRSCR
jgi:hypothetical protein